MYLQPKTEAGKLFADRAEEHLGPFRERAREHDESSAFATRNFDDLRKSGILAAFVPEELGGLGLDSVHD